MNEKPGMFRTWSEALAFIGVIVLIAAFGGTCAAVAWQLAQ